MAVAADCVTVKHTICLSLYEINLNYQQHHLINQEHVHVHVHI